MSGLLGRAGAVFVAPAPAAERAAAPPPDLVAVLAGEADAPAVAAGVAATLRRRHGARAALVLSAGRPPGRCVATRAAAALAQRLVERDIPAAACGRLCRAELPGDPEAFVRDAWRAITAAAAVPAVVAVAQRSEPVDALLRDADLRVLAVPPGTAEAYVEAVLDGLAALGPIARLRPPASGPARRLAAAGAAGLEWQPA